ncbi:MAG: PAS-domain containing protein [Proteobacteria bacterium]|nr:PAS-domain containing protein [Pseudomonadota bacterium]
MVLQAWTVVLAGLAYVGFLFAVATWGDRIATASRKRRHPRPLIYALSLAVYCTSWTYFGSVGIAANTAYDFIPVYLGPILMFVLGAPLISRIVMVAKSQNIASIADFIAARYGKSEALGALVAVIAVFGIVPYISIQLKALAFSLQAMVHPSYWAGGGHIGVPLGGDIALVVTVAMAAFAILFGTRHIDATEHQDGMILAVAVESVVKLFAFMAVGLFVVFGIGGGPSAMIEAMNTHPDVSKVFAQAPEGGRWLTVTLLSACAILLLPRQFHVAVVENAHGSDVRRAAWLFPLYLVAINIFVVPIAITGLMLLPGADADTYVLALPVFAQSKWFSLIAFIGGVSAATAMVIVETIALAIMLSNNVIVPLVLLRQGEQNMFQRSADGGKSPALIVIRRAAICAILALAYLYYAFAGNSAALAQTGLISFAAVAQFAPAFFGGLLWRGGTARAASAGILAGFAMWAYTLLIPSFADSGWISGSLMSDGPFGITALRPRQLLGLEFDSLTHGVLWSLIVNVAVYVGLSVTRTPNRAELLQADSFVSSDRHVRFAPSYRMWRSSVTIGQVEETVARYIGREQAREAFARMVKTRDLADDSRIEADISVLNFGEHLLASAVGPSSSRLVMALLLERHSKSSREAIQLLDEASSAIEHSHTVLQSAIDSIPQGIAVLSKQGELVSWNSTYKEMLNVPAEDLRVGKPLEEILAFIAAHAQEMDVMPLPGRRDWLMRQEGTYRLRLNEPPRIIDVHGSQLPDGGVVVTFSDVSVSVAAADALQQVNETLERRVHERTQELTKLNEELEKARAEAERANLSKTRFIAAASHDILQPLNAARLFTSTLVEQQDVTPHAETVKNVDAALEAVEDILSTVLDISRLDAGAVKPELTSFPVRDLFATLDREFQPAASKKNLNLRFTRTTVLVRSDRKLLRRILQNLVSNAIKYTDKGSVLVAVKRRGEQAVIEVRDSGPGIPKEKQKAIFREFERLSRDKGNAPGLGLGLSIVERMCKVLKHPIKVVSEPGRGTLFSVTIPIGKGVSASATPAAMQEVVQGNLRGLHVLAIDNEPAIVEGLTALLKNWGVTVVPAHSAPEAIKAFGHGTSGIDAVLADYHIHRDDGIALVQRLRQDAGRHVPAILITADRSRQVQDDAAAAGIVYLRKPVRPAALRASLSQIAARQQAAE